MTEIRPFLVNGDWRTGEGTLEVRSPFDDAVVAELGVPTEADVEEAIADRFRDVRGVAEALCRGPFDRARPHIATARRDAGGERSR